LLILQVQVGAYRAFLRGVACACWALALLRPQAEPETATSLQWHMLRRGGDHGHPHLTTRQGREQYS
jgi:hypothetical protein